MSRVENGAFIIEPETPQQCDSCGEIRELRPYGPPGKTMICFACMKLDEPACIKRYQTMFSSLDNTNEG